MGGASQAKLNNLGVFTVERFAALPSAWIRKLMTVTGQRTHAELNGVSCMQLLLVSQQRRTISVTRMFGPPVETWGDMREALAAYAARAAEKARLSNSFQSGPPMGAEEGPPFPKLRAAMRVAINKRRASPRGEPLIVQRPGGGSGGRLNRLWTSRRALA